MAVVATYHYGNAKVEILDDYYSKRTKEEHEQARQELSRVCTRIMMQKLLREQKLERELQMPREYTLLFRATESYLRHLEIKKSALSPVIESMADSYIDDDIRTLWDLTQKQERGLLG